LVREAPRVGGDVRPGHAHAWLCRYQRKALPKLVQEPVRIRRAVESNVQPDLVQVGLGRSRYFER
jgi:hypothetical protein